MAVNWSVFSLSLCIIIAAARSTYITEATPLTSYYGKPNTDFMGGRPEVEAISLLSSMGHTRSKDSDDSKDSTVVREMDLGLGRTYSGAQAAKQLMALAAANFAGGPGKRKRMNEAAFRNLANREITYGVCFDALRQILQWERNMK